MPKPTTTRRRKPKVKAPMTWEDVTALRGRLGPYDDTVPPPLTNPTAPPSYVASRPRRAVVLPRPASPSGTDTADVIQTEEELIGRLASLRPLVPPHLSVEWVRDRQRQRAIRPRGPAALLRPMQGDPDKRRARLHGLVML